MLESLLPYLSSPQLILFCRRRGVGFVASDKHRILQDTRDMSYQAHRKMLKLIDKYLIEYDK